MEDLSFVVSLYSDDVSRFQGRKIDTCSFDIFLGKAEVHPKGRISFFLPA